MSLQNKYYGGRIMQGVKEGSFTQGSETFGGSSCSTSKQIGRATPRLRRRKENYREENYRGCQEKNYRRQQRQYCRQQRFPGRFRNALAATTFIALAKMPQDATSAGAGGPASGIPMGAIPLNTDWLKDDLLKRPDRKKRQMRIRGDGDMEEDPLRGDEDEPLSMSQLFLERLLF